jgi:hypothetical protein
MFFYGLFLEAGGTSKKIFWKASVDHNGGRIGFTGLYGRLIQKGY